MTATATSSLAALRAEPSAATFSPYEPLCRACGAPLRHTFVDLGMSPLCESFVPADRLNAMEPFYPLHARVCATCFLVQLEQYVAPQDIFNEYAYYSSYSDSWVRHAEAYVERIIPLLGLGRGSRVVEIASNDGYLLQHFARRGIPALGVEPAENVALAAAAKGIRTLVEFFDRESAARLLMDGPADLIIGNNVLAQVPALNDFVAAMRLLLAPEGIITLEFPHLLRLIQRHQFDTIYHEHFSYFSLLAVRSILERQGLRLFNVEELGTHGGSLRIYACRAEAGWRSQAVVEELEALERAQGLASMHTYEEFGQRAMESKHGLLRFLINARRRGHSVAGYGAPGKGNTLLNYCGIRTDLLAYTV
ncbi:MAG: methyltransferase domain-containing protein, partial [Chloroflexota bacterium]